MPVPVRSLGGLEAALPDVDRVIVDLTARAYDGVDAVARAHAAGKPVLAVGQHDDIDLRRRALAAGADRVHPYRQLFEDGPRQLAAWLACCRGVTPMISSRPSIPAARYGERIAAAQRRADAAGFAALLVGVGADLRYLTGYPAMPLERLTMLVIPADGDPSLVAPRLEAPRRGRARPPRPATSRSSPGRRPTTRTRSSPGWSVAPSTSRAAAASGSPSPTTFPRVTCCASETISTRRISSSPRRSRENSGS